MNLLRRNLGNPTVLRSGPAAGIYVTAASDWDGTNDSAARGGDLTGIADGKEGSLFFWVNKDADGVEYTIYEHSSSAVLVRLTTLNQIDLILRNSGGTIIVRRITSDTVLAASGWSPVYLSWDLAATTVQVYFGDTATSFGTSTPTTNDNINYTAGDVGIGARAVGAGSKLDGCLSEFVFHTQFLDLSNESNRRILIDAQGRPRNINADGSRPFGEQPLIYAPDGDPSDNKGSGGDFTITGSLAVCGDSP